VPVALETYHHLQDLPSVRGAIVIAVLTLTFLQAPKPDVISIEGKEKTMVLEYSEAVLCVVLSGESSSQLIDSHLSSIRTFGSRFLD
jgi:hypothetical protein